MTPECPDRNTLWTLLRGDLEDPRRAEVRRHVDDCPACAARVRELIADEVRSAPTGAATVRSLDPVVTTSTVAYQPSGTPASTPSPDAVLRWVRGLLSEPTVPDALGRVGIYEVVAVLGHGGMGVVLKAWDPRLDRSVAIKLLAPQLATHPTATARFGREARAAAALRHPNVVGIHEIAEQGGMPYLVMEFVSGQTLLDRIRANPLDVPTIVRYARQLADGLAAVHAKGVVHRDIKPSNVLIESDTERVVLSDFGLALVCREGSDLTSAGHALGTPAYMAPEQVRGERADRRSDLFSLGCVIYAMAVGRSPFDAHAMPRPDRPAWTRPRPLHEVRPDVPRDLSDLVQRLLAEAPADRPATATDVRDVLDRKAVGLTVAGPPARSVRGRRWWPAAAAAVLAIAAGVVAVAARPWGSGGPGDPAGTIPSVVPPTSAQPHVPRTITVAQAGGGDYRTIAEAVARAGPGDTVRILDDAVYPEAVKLNDPDRLASVTLVADARATLAPPAAAAEAVSVKNTPGVVVRGLRFKLHASQHGVAVAGPTGALLDDLDLEQPGDAEWSLVVVAWGAGPALGHPVRVRNSTFRAGKHGLIVGGEGDRVSGVEVEGNRFLRGQYHLTVCNAADDVVARGNVFCGDVGLTVDLPPTSRRLRVENNTFWQTPRWLSVLNPDGPSEVEVYNNLVLGADEVEVKRLSVDDLARRWSFHHNHWEPGPMTDRNRAGVVADLAEAVRLESRDPADPNFLRPPPGSPLGTRGAGGASPAHVGAIPPAAGG